MAHAVVHHGNALTVLRELTDTVDAVITDPPYNSGGRTASERGNQRTRDKYVSSDAHHDLADFTGDNRDQRSYAYWLTLVLGECYRLTRDGGSCLAFTDWRQLPATTDAMQAAGWTWRGIVTWHKPLARPLRDGFKRECEFIVWGSHGEPIRHAPPVYLRGLYSGSQPRGRERKHITQKPVEVMAELVKITPAGGTVLDPFCGSGSTGVAALQEGRRFVGVELSEHYRQVAVQRLAACSGGLREARPE